MPAGAAMPVSSGSRDSGRRDFPTPGSTWQRHGERPGTPTPAYLPAMPYAVKEIFYTLQGEGAHVGRPAVFCRFAGCDLWTGREADRAGAVCDFCDTDFV